jgi:hypothetical protein
MGLRRIDLNDCIYRNLLAICLVGIIPCGAAHGGGRSYYFASQSMARFGHRRGLTSDEYKELGAAVSRLALGRAKPSSPVHNHIIGRVRKDKLNPTFLICLNRLGKVERHQFNLFIPVSDGIVIAARIQHLASDRVLPDFLATTIAIDEHRRRELVRRSTSRQSILGIHLSARDPRSRAPDVGFSPSGLRSSTFRARAARHFPEVIGPSTVLVRFRPVRADFDIPITPQLDEQRLSLLRTLVSTRGQALCGTLEHDDGRRRRRGITAPGGQPAQKRIGQKRPWRETRRTMAMSRCREV